EVVLDVTRHSGVYRDLDHLFGALLAFGVTLFILFTPHEIHPWSVPLPMVAAYAGGLYFCRHSGLRRLLSRRARRERQCLSSARASFVRNQVHRTRDRTGLLIHFSILEGRATFVADAGVKAALGA